MDYVVKLGSKANIQYKNLLTDFQESFRINSKFYLIQPPIQPIVYVFTSPDENDE
jgi:hypothetical protein